jgi:hypothetical protein
MEITKQDQIKALYMRVQELETELFTEKHLSPQESWAEIMKLSAFLVQNFNNYGEATRQRINKFEQALEFLNDELMKEFAKDDTEKQEG